MASGVVLAKVGKGSFGLRSRTCLNRSVTSSGLRRGRAEGRDRTLVQGVVTDIVAAIEQVAG